jgi:hypothetical protein
VKNKSVWLHRPFGNPKKILFSVTEDEVSLGDKVFPAGEVVDCKQSYPKSLSKPVNIILSYGLLGWTLYEMYSLFFRLSAYILLPESPDLDTARANEKAQELLQLFLLRTSTTDEQQLQLFLCLFVFSILYGLIFSNLIFRPRVVLHLKNGDVAEASYLLVRPRKFVKTLAAGRKISKKTRKSLKSR